MFYIMTFSISLQTTMGSIVNSKEIRAGASSAAHFNNREERTPSGPAAEVEESS